MFRKSHLLCFLFGICLILANAQEQPEDVQEVPVTVIEEEVLPQEGEEYVTEESTTLEPDLTQFEGEGELVEGEEEYVDGGEEFVEGEEELEEEVPEEVLIDLCTYNPDAKGEVQITYEVVSETDNKVIQVSPAGEEDPNKVLNDCLSLQDVESRSRRRNQMLKRRRKMANRRRRRKNPRRGNRFRKQQIMKRRRNKLRNQRIKMNRRRKAQKKNRQKLNRRKNLTYEQQILEQIQKLLNDKEIASKPDSLNRMIKLTQNLLLRAVGETPQNILKETEAPRKKKVN